MMNYLLSMAIKLNILDNCFGIESAKRKQEKKTRIDISLFILSQLLDENKYMKISIIGIDIDNKKQLNCYTSLYLMNEILII